MKRIVGILLCLMFFSIFLTSCTRGVMGKKLDINKINKNVIDGTSQFAFNIFKELNSEDHDSSILISPLSISTALTMTYNGSASTTREAMEGALGYKGIEKAEISQSYKTLLDYLDSIDKGVELNTANSIWIREGEAIKEDFLTNNKSNFNAEISELDFSKEASVDTINKWISKATRNKINNALESPLDPSVKMYLINAIYFKGEWRNKFNTENTYDHDFYAFGGNTQRVRMMNRTGDVDYIEGEDYKAVRLPYGKGNTSMYFILPDEGIDINNFIENMSFQKWEGLRKNISEVDNLILEIPRFKFEYGIKNLNSSLTSLGMGEALSEQADFSGIRDDLYIDRVLHKAVIEVNEEGSEAAAATVVRGWGKSAPMPPTPFIADRPFMFIIVEEETGAILFMGKLLSVE